MRSGLIFGLFFSVAQIVYAADYGVFMVVKGKVKIQNATSAADAKVGSKIYEGDTVSIEAESRAKIVMSDRNIINVSPNTKLKIDKYSSNPKDKNVKLNLIEGKVRNNVEQKYDGKNSKFEVRTATAVAGVRGTQFITSFNSTTRVTEVVTLKGQVSFQSLNPNDASSSADPIVINKGEKSETQESGGTSAPTKVPETEIRQIESDTNVKKDRPEGSSAGGTASTTAPSETRSQPSGASSGSKSGLDSLNNQKNPVLDGATTRKYEKSKVKIIPELPNN